MAEFPALPLWTDAYLGDTMHLTLEEHGAYLKLLIIAWRSPDCALPNDDARLARMLGITPKKWATIKPGIAAFFTIDKTHWTQKKLTKTRRAVADSSSKQSSRAKARWERKPLENNDGADAAGVPDGMPDLCRGNATKTITKTIREKETPSGVSQKTRGCRLPDDWKPNDDLFPDALHDRICELIPQADRADWVNDQLASFADYWTAKSGAGAAKLDWDKALHNWLRKELNDVRKRNWGRIAAQEARVLNFDQRKRG
jgi:uncharacterized protein YdaU (DUF1376 family)